MNFLSNLNPKIGGMLIALIGIAGNVYNWYGLLNEGTYFVKASILFPFFIFLGLSMILYPMSKEERLSRYGDGQIPWRDYPKGQKVLLIAGILIGLLQFAYFDGLI